MFTKWEEIRNLMKQNQGKKEEYVQWLFERIFAESFGYSLLSGEIDSHRAIRLGSTDRVVPDIILRNASENKDLFIVELKQLSLPLDNGFRDQLLSYMRLLSLKIGVLICDAIYIFSLVDGKLDSIKINWQTDDNRGEKFFELFKRDGFSVEKVIDFILENRRFDINVSKIKKEVELIDLKEVVKGYFSSSYEESEIDFALNDYDFSVIKKSPGTGIGSVTKKGPGSTSVAPLGKETIQNWVKRIVSYLLKNHVLTQQEMRWLHDRDYSFRTFGIGHPLFVDSETQIRVGGHLRYWTEKIEGVFVCSQWWKDNDSKYEQLIRQWLARVCVDFQGLGLDRR